MTLTLPARFMKGNVTVCGPLLVPITDALLQPGRATTSMPKQWLRGKSGSWWERQVVELVTPSLATTLGFFQGGSEGRVSGQGSGFCLGVIQGVPSRSHLPAVHSQKQPLLPAIAFLFGKINWVVQGLSLLPLLP